MKGEKKEKEDEDRKRKIKMESLIVFRGPTLGMLLLLLLLSS